MQRRILSRLRNLEVAQEGASTAHAEQAMDMPANPVAWPITSRVEFREPGYYTPLSARS
ncbi:unnamed protein product [Schistocephalus solidus]|uniref:Transposase n=1 Tax=Schistocephalus solidus TaxID=70667 RepID=A0A183TC24_SCHSO|nr:unnamed protein product [Schistocephalus solidus]